MASLCGTRSDEAIACPPDAMHRPRARAARRGRDAWTVAAIGAVAAALTAALVVASGSRPPEGPSRAPPPSDRGREPRPAPQQAKAAVPTPAPVVPRVELTLTPPYEVADGLTIVSETRRVRLAGLEGPGSEAACFDPGGRLWACGLQARAALYNLIRMKPVTCRTTGASASDLPLVDCQVGTTPLARALVQQGFARPVDDGSGLSADLAEARSAGRGLWNGGWRLKP